MKAALSKWETTERQRQRSSKHYIISIGERHVTCNRWRYYCIYNMCAHFFSSSVCLRVWSALSFDGQPNRMMDVSCTVVSSFLSKQTHDNTTQPKSTRFLNEEPTVKFDWRQGYGASWSNGLRQFKKKRTHSKSSTKVEQIANINIGYTCARLSVRVIM